MISCYYLAVQQPQSPIFTLKIHYQLTYVKALPPGQFQSAIYGKIHFAHSSTASRSPIVCNEFVSHARTTHTTFFFFCKLIQHAIVKNRKKLMCKKVYACASFSFFFLFFIEGNTCKNTYTSPIAPVHAQVLQKQHRLMLASDKIIKLSK